MKGSTPPQIAEIIIKLVKDMAAVSYYLSYEFLFYLFRIKQKLYYLLKGHLSDAWSRVTKNAIAETIIALTKMEEEHRAPVRCIATTRVGSWILLLSLLRMAVGHWYQCCPFLSIALASLSLTLCPGPGSCRQALLWSVDGERWSTKTDGISGYL